MPPPTGSAPITVAMAADARYELPLTVTLCSALANLERERELVAYIIDDGLPPEARERVAASTADGRCTLKWLPAPQQALNRLPRWGNMPATTYSRLLLADLLPASVENVLWLDCDLLVLGDLADLWNTPLRVACAGAVPDPFIPFLGSRFGLRGLDELGLPQNAAYFNAGVMLIDLERWRSSDVGGQALEFLRRYGERVCYQGGQDQAALNAVLFGCWTELPRRWNSTPRGDSASNNGDAEHDPAILHFAGSLKPWRFQGDSPAQRLYFQYLDRTSWSGWRPPGSLKGSLLRRYEESRIRRWTRPLEQRLFEAYMIATRHYGRNDVNS